MKNEDSSAWETDEEQSAKDEADKVNLYIGYILKSQSEAKDWQNECRAAWKEFQAEFDTNRFRKFMVESPSSFPRYWSDTLTMLPAIFSEIPTVVVRPESEKDFTATLASLSLEKLAAWLIRRSDFRSKMTTIALEYLNSSRATARVYFDATIEKRKKRIQLFEEQIEIPEAETPQETQGEAPEGQEQPQTQTIMVDSEGNEYQDNIMYDQDGAPYVEVDGEEEEVKNPRVYFEPLFFDQILISPGARTFNDIWFIAYQVTLTRREAFKKFGDIVKEIKVPSQESTPFYDAGYSSKSSSELFQFWCLEDKRDKKFYYIHEEYDKGFLKPIDTENSDNAPPFDLPDFYSSPRWMITNERYSDQYPVPDYTQTRDLYTHLHVLFKRMNRVASSIKGVGLFNGANVDLVALFNESYDGQGIACSDYKDLTTNTGSLDGEVWFPPYERLAATLQTLISTFMTMKDLIDEIRGISDIVRGFSNPDTTLGAEKLKNQNSSNRVSVRRKELERFVRDLIEMMCDVSLQTFDEESLKEIMEYQFMSEEGQAQWEAQLSLMQDSSARKIRLEIETDSLIAINEQQEKADAAELLQAFGSFIRDIGPTVTQAPYLMPVAVKVSEIALSKYRYGKNIQDELQQMFSGIQEQMSQPPPQQPPAPDPRLLKVQSDERIAELEANVKMRMAEMDNQLSQMELQLKGAEFQLKQQGQSFSENIQSQELGFKEQESQVMLQEKVQQEQRLEEQNVMIPEERLQQHAQMNQMMGIQPQMMGHPPINIINVPAQPQMQQPTQIVQPIVNQPSAPPQVIQPIVQQAPQMAQFNPYGVL